MKTFLSFVFALLLIPSIAGAQTFVRLQPDRKTGTIAANGESVTMTSGALGAFGSVKIQTLDSYSGTWEVQCSLDGSTFDADNELKLTAADGSSTVYSVTDEVGIWDIGNASGCRSIKIIATAGFAASDSAFVISATQSGGSGGGGGAAAGLTDTELRATAVAVTCGDCSGSGVTHQDDGAFNDETDDVVPIAGIFADASPDSVAEDDAGAIRMSANRNLYTTIRDAAGNERGALVTANNELLVELGAGSAAIGTVTVTDGAGALNVIVDSSASVAVTNAGTFVTQIDGAALTSLQLTDNIVSVEDAVAGSGFSGVGFLAVRQDSHSDLAADGDFIPVTVDADGGLRVSIVAGAGSGGTALADDADFTAGTTSGTPVNGFYQSSVTACTDGDTCTMGITAQRAVKVTLYNEAGSALTPSADVVEDAAETAGGTGPFVQSVRRDTRASSAGSTGDNASFNTSATGDLYTNDVNLATGASGLKRTSAGATEDEHEVKATAGVLYSIVVTNTNADERYLRCANLTAANAAPGTSTPIIDLAIPGNASGAGFTTSFPQGFAFSTALTCWMVTGAADTDVAEVAANEIKAFYTFK